MKRCKWCETQRKTFWSHDPDGQGVQVHVLKNRLWIYSNERCSNIEFEMPINYCPMCGKSFN